MSRWNTDPFGEMTNVSVEEPTWSLWDTVRDDASSRGASPAKALPFAVNASTVHWENHELR